MQVRELASGCYFWPSQTSPSRHCGLLLTRESHERSRISGQLFKGTTEISFWDFYALSTTGDAAAIKDRGVDAVEIWDVRRGQRSSILTEPKPKKRSTSSWSGTTELAFSASGQTLVARDMAANQRLGMRLRIWTRLASDSSPIQIPLGSWEFAVSPDGRLVAGVGKGDKAVSIWDTKTGDVVMKLPFAKKGTPALSGLVIGMAFTPDGKELVVNNSIGEQRGTLTAFAVTPATGTPTAAEILTATGTPTAATGRLISEADHAYERPEVVLGLQQVSQTGMSFLDGGKTLVTLTSKRDKRTNVHEWHIYYWDMVAGGEKRPAAKFFTNEFSSDLHVASLYGDVLAMTIDERHRIRGQIRIVDLATGKTRAEIALRAGDNVNSLFVDAAGKHLGAGKSDLRLQVWELGPPIAAGSHEATKQAAPGPPKTARHCHANDRSGFAGFLAAGSLNSGGRCPPYYTIQSKTMGRVARTRDSESGSRSDKRRSKTAKRPQRSSIAIDPAVDDLSGTQPALN